MNDGTSSAIVLERCTKRFDATVAVDAVSFEIPAGEFFSMLGPSGCGKTTTLRMIAGFEMPDDGRIWLAGRDVTAMAPQKRPVNMVFQAYGLFPHMSVADNVAFGLRIKKLPRDEIAVRVAETIGIVRLDGMEDRRPGQLSGGQQQRVALARALVNRPAALLLDEPLGALDLQLRKEMQLELKHLQERTGTTFVYVTHDQEEAMTMSDRIAVMRGGIVEQLGTPRELYATPASAFVAGFIGVSNLVTLRVDRHEAGLLAMELGEGDRILAADPQEPAGSNDRPDAPRDACTVTVRPEWIKLGGEAGPRDSRVSGTVADVVYLGSVTQLRVELPTGEALTVHRLNDEVDATDPRPGDRVTLRWAADHTYVIGGRGTSDEHGARAPGDPSHEPVRSPAGG